MWWTVLSETWSALSGILTEYLTVLMAVSTVVTAIATLVIAIGIVYTARQFKFSTWLKAQEIFTGYKLTKSRTQILQKFPYYKKLTSMIGTADEQAAKELCRRMDELARLVPYISKENVLETWDYPLGKSWMILEPTVRDEREKTYHPDKWEAFKDLGEQAVRKYGLEEKNKEWSEKT